MSTDGDFVRTFEGLRRFRDRSSEYLSDGIIKICRTCFPETENFGVGPCQLRPVQLFQVRSDFCCRIKSHENDRDFTFSSNSTSPSHGAVLPLPWLP